MLQRFTLKRGLPLVLLFLGVLTAQAIYVNEQEEVKSLLFGVLEQKGRQELKRLTIWMSQQPQDDPAKQVQAYFDQGLFFYQELIEARYFRAGVLMFAKDGPRKVDHVLSTRVLEVLEADEQVAHYPATYEDLEGEQRLLVYPLPRSTYDRQGQPDTIALILDFTDPIRFAQERAREQAWVEAFVLLSGFFLCYFVLNQWIISRIGRLVQLISSQDQTQLDKLTSEPFQDEISVIQHAVADLLQSLEHKRLIQQELKVQNNLRELTDSLPLMVFQLRIASPESITITFHNRRFQEIFQVSPDDLAPSAMKLMDTVYHEDRESLNSTLMAAILTKRPWSHTYRLVHPDGEIHWYFGTGILSEDATSYRINCYLENVTEQKHREQALQDALAKAEAAVAARSAFLANVSHEMRTPLNAVIGIAHLALRNAQEPSQREYLTKIHSSSLALLGLINDLLDMAKVEAGRLELHMDRFSLYDVLRQVGTVTAQRAEEKGLELVFHPTDLRYDHLQGDPMRLTQVLINLVHNAIKFTHKGEVQVRVMLDEELPGRCRLLFSVQDTGIGIEPEQRTRLFNPFEQVDNSTTRRFGGTGLGLSICRRLVEMMGGRIWVDSIPGQGSTFYFTSWFEVSPNEAEVGTQQFAAGQKPCVMLIDDHGPTREMLTQALESFGLESLAFSSGVAALQYLQSAPRLFTLVLLDWKMPGLNGLQTAEALTRHYTRLGQVAPAMALMTAFEGAEIRAKAREAGISRFVSKPVNLLQLQDLLRPLLGVQDQPVEPSPPPADTTLRLDNVRVLVAEDNEINQEIMTELLTSVGAQVWVADDGLAVLHQLLGPDLANPQPSCPLPMDLILMDVQMPRLDGLETTRILREYWSLDELPILAMTAHVGSEERNLCLSAGMNAHLSKPIEPELMLQLISAYTTGQVRRTTPANVFSPLNLPDVEGLDIRGGLRRSADNGTLYLTMLERFASEYAEAPIKLDRMVRAQDWESLCQFVHTLRGTGANLGVVLVVEPAQRLEQLCSGPPTIGPLQQSISRLSTALTQELAAIRKLLNQAKLPSEPPALSSHTELMEQLQHLKHLLEISDGEALDLVEAVQQRLRPLVDYQELHELRLKVVSLDFEAALSILSHIQLRLQRNTP
ncbi:MAG: response regulator [Myxococcota bacterium]